MQWWWGLQSAVRSAAITFPTYTRVLARLLDDRQRRANLATIRTRTSNALQFTCGDVVFVAAALPRAVGLTFGLLHDAVCGVLLRGGEVDAGEERVVDGFGVFVALFALGGFAGFCDAADEADEAVAVAFGGYGRDLGFRVCHAFYEVLHALDDGVLWIMLVVSRGLKVGALRV